MDRELGVSGGGIFVLNRLIDFKTLMYMYLSVNRWPCIST